jgi:AcrR family transcriptional regulator
MSDERGTWRGTSAEDRVADRRARLVAACLRLLAEDPDRAPTIRGVCREAGVGPRHLYELFPDMDALIVAAHDEGVAILREAVDGAVEGLAGAPVDADDVTDRLTRLFDAVVTVIERDPGIAAVLIRLPTRDQRLRSHAARTTAGFVGAMRALVVSDPAPPEVEELEITFLVGALATVFVRWTVGGIGADRALLVRYCVAASVAVLGLDASRPV